MIVPGTRKPVHTCFDETHLFRGTHLHQGVQPQVQGSRRQRNLGAIIRRREPLASLRRLPGPAVLYESRRELLPIAPRGAQLPHYALKTPGIEWRTDSTASRKHLPWHLPVATKKRVPSSPFVPPCRSNPFDISLGLENEKRFSKRRKRCVPQLPGSRSRPCHDSRRIPEFRACAV